MSAWDEIWIADAEDENEWLDVQQRLAELRDALQGSRVEGPDPQGGVETRGGHPHPQVEGPGF